MTRTTTIASLLAAGTLSAAFALVPSRAEACGGFFCDAGQPMPVDQSGEDILFVADGETVEAHIRIQYEGDPENFGWVIPVLSVPTEMKVGVDQLFTNIKNASVPRYGFQSTFDSCGDDDGGGDDGFNGGTSGGALSPGAEDGDGGVEILRSETVGAFDIVVITSDTAQNLIDWLDENGYQQDPDALPIFEEYLEEDHKFVGVKLNGGSGLEELHPIALTFEHSEPCVPLRLTRIAALEDMDVRTYFLGDARVVPQNYRHVLVNDLKIDWPNNGANYKEVISLAVDSDEANGRAFVTEYAGESNIVSQLGAEFWDAEALGEVTTAAEAIELLWGWGLLNCGWDPQTGLDSCGSPNPLADALIAEHLPAPESIDPWSYYSEPQAYEGLAEPFDAATFSMLFTHRVIEPAQHADQLLANNPYLTRMYTTISPQEMTVDPMFHENGDLEDIPNVRQAQRRVGCNGAELWTLPDGRNVILRPGESWPEIGDASLYASRVEETPNGGAALVLLDNTEAIADSLEEHNAGREGLVEEPMAGDDGNGGGGGTTGTTTGGVDTDGVDTDGFDGAGFEGDDISGCGCTATNDRTGALGTLVLLGLMAIRRRRS